MNSKARVFDGPMPSQPDKGASTYSRTSRLRDFFEPMRLSRSRKEVAPAEPSVAAFSSSLINDQNKLENIQTNIYSKLGFYYLKE
jgi:hypothetical protein